MNSGYFFELSENTSFLCEGVIDFTYTAKHSDKQLELKYPISLNITKNAVVFKMHSFVKEECDENMQNNKEKTCHVNNTIVALPFSNNEEITKILKSLYCMSFPMLSNNTNEGPRPPISYSSLSVFGNSRDVKEQKTDTNILRNLFLDFLFDLQHSNVFKISPWYDKMLFHLNQNYYFTALRNKAEFYYQRELINDDELEECAIRNRNSKKCKKCEKCKECKKILYKNHEFLLSKFKIIGKNFVDAENRWLASIQAPQADENFLMPVNWVDGDVDDMSWFLPPEREMEKVYFENKESGYIRNSINLLNVILKNEKKDHHSNILKRANNIRIQTAASVKWSLNRHSYRYIFNLGSIISCFVVACVGAGISVFFCFLHSECLSIFKYSNLTFDKFRILHFFFIFICCIISLLIICLFIRFTHKKMNKYSKYIFTKFINIQIFQPRLISTIITAWITLNLSDGLFKLLLNHSQYNMIIPFVICMIITILTISFLSYEVKRKVPYLRWWQTIKRACATCIIGWLYSMSIGIIGIIAVSFLSYGNNLSLSSLTLCGVSYYLVTTSSLALFIGVFLQRMMEECD